jgi:MFS family permease
MLPREHDDDHVPGTVYLVDVNGQAISVIHDASHKDIALVPRPSSDSNDPLNWTPRRKLLAGSMAYLYVFGTEIATSLQYSVLADITADTGISTANLVEGTGVMFLFFGWACLIWQPVALTYGRRGVYLITTLLTVPLMIWTAYSSSSPEWFAHRVLLGIVVSPIESLCEVTVLDLYFAHNRGRYMGLYVFILFGINFLAPLVAGWFNDAYGWRWTMHFGAIVCAVAFLIIFFFMEETMYFRESVYEGQRIEPPRSQPSVKVEDGEKDNLRPATLSRSVSIHAPLKRATNAGSARFTPFKWIRGSTHQSRHAAYGVSSSDHDLSPTNCRLGWLPPRYQSCLLQCPQWNCKSCTQC